MSNKRYFWLKLNEDFFDDDTISWLEEQENGKEYVIFYLKLALRSLKDNGYLIRYVGEKLIPYDVKALSKLTNTSSDTVAVAMKSFIEIGLVSQLESGEIYLNQIKEMVGSETRQASIMRRKRAKEQQLLSENESNNVTSQGNIVKKSYSDVNKSYTEIELEKEKEIELDKELEQEKDIFQSSLSDVINFYQNNFGIMSPIIQDDLIHWSNDLSPDLVVEAMKKAAFNLKPYSYAKGILSNWLKTNIKTLEQVKQSELQFELNKQQKTQSPYKRSQKIENVPEHMKKPYVEKELSAEEKERLAREEERIRNKLKNLSGSEEV